MPFTLAHPAVVIPMGKLGKRLSLTGLVVGSMAPDFEFFFQMREVENIGHYWHGILLFDLPVAFLVATLFHTVLRNNLIANLPAVYRKRFIHLKSFNWVTYVRANKWTVFLSFMLGVLSHLALDAFTHGHTWIAQEISFLRMDIRFMDEQLPVYFLLQILSSLLGMFLVHFQIMQMPVQEENQCIHKIDYRYWMSIGLLFFAIMSCRLIIWPEWNSFGGILIAIMGGLFYSWLPTTLFFNHFINIKKIKS